MKVNYLIAAACHRAIGDYGGGIDSKEILRLHLRELARTDTTQLAQVTLLRALPLVRNGNAIEESVHFWDIDKLVPTIKCPVVILDVRDMFFSYSSWIQACQRYQEEFDYYILCEDDFYPANTDFVSVLVSLHRRKLVDGGYLNSFTTNHAALSNGIVDGPSFVKGLLRYSDPLAEIAPDAQALFSQKFFPFLTDYTDNYRCLSWSGSGYINEFTHYEKFLPKVDIFRPIQYLGVGERPFPRGVRDLQELMSIGVCFDEGFRPDPEIVQSFRVRTPEWR